jgi:hypothetical protein
MRRKAASIRSDQFPILNSHPRRHVEISAVPSDENWELRIDQISPRVQFWRMTESGYIKIAVEMKKTGKLTY